MPWSCVRGARGRFGGVGTGAGCCVFPVSPGPPRASCAVCGGLSRRDVPYPRSLVRHSMRSVRSAGSVRLPSWFSPRVLCVCVRSRSRDVRAPSSPPRVGVARAPQAPPVLGAGRAVPLGPCPSACPASVPCSVWLAPGGRRPGPVSPYLAWSCAPPLGWVPAWGPVTNTTQRALASWPCVLAWRAIGAARGRPGRAPPAWSRGVRGRALSLPRPLVLSGLRPGPTTHWLWVREVRVWAPVTLPTARALASWLCGLWGRHEGARGGRLLPGWGASGVRRSPTPDHPSFRACSRAPLPTGCGCGGCGRGDPSPTPQRALLRAGFARCGGSMRVPGGVASCLGVEHPGSGALPSPTTRPFGRAAGPHYPLAVCAGVAGVETRHRPHSAR